METVLSTHNKNKVAEMEGFLSDVLGGEKILTPEEVGISGEAEENGTTFEENALLKARYVWKAGRLCIADDSGLTVNALGGEPGIYSARYAGEPCDNAKNNAKLLKNLEGKEDRSASFVCAIACILPDGREFTVRGKADGIILKEYRGQGGFGYDPLFFFPSLGKTFAELSRDEKNAVSHRGNALRLFKEELKKYL